MRTPVNLRTAVAPGVWVAARDGGPPSGHPGDLAAARAMAPWRAEEFLAGRGLLRELLARVAPAAANAGVPAGGRPEVAGWPGLGVSVSHDEGTVAAAVAVGHAVGVDVQHAGGQPAPGLVRRILHDHLVSDPVEELVWVWTVQEACVKADGTGIAGQPWAIDVPPYQETGRWRALRWRSLREVSAIPLSVAWGRS